MILNIYIYFSIIIIIIIIIINNNNWPATMLFHWKSL